MKEFDYKKAWQQVAFPGWKSLPANARDLVFKVSCALNYGQSANLDMEWPAARIGRGESITLPEACVKQLISGTKCSEDIGHEMFYLRERFQKLESIWLAKAACIVHNYGHWAPGVFEDVKWNARCAEAQLLQRTGAHWKFSNLCDQVLTERLGMVRARTAKSQRGISYVVINGALRACCNTQEMWTWREVGWATLANWEGVSSIARPALFTTNRTPSRHEEMFTAYAEKVTAKTTNDGFKEMHDITSFMEERG